MSQPSILFVTGTDTDCGKTTIASQLLKSLNVAGLTTIGLKPIVSGGLDDVKTLQQSASIPLSVEQCNVYNFPEPIAPHIAATWHHQTIELEKLVAQVTLAKSLDPDVIVIEGAGGWMVPLSSTLSFADYVRAIHAQVLLVVGVKLGCINHALLTARAIEQDKIKMHGWVANIFDKNQLALSENLTTLEQHISAPKIYPNSFSSLTVA